MANLKRKQLKLVKLGMWWHIMERRKVPVFKFFYRYQWFTIFPYYYNKEEAKEAFNKIKTTI
ncbi:hypothetical protein BPT24_251 [Tenacibaculum phage pT24]|uniref:Uncharacterized protein n=1 Tax=Tenacibaculum phage pT24 TaxID=1880590 RepID=A0A1B4XX36_9CAUD|nr:hypothetical protein HYP10_gp277 [Tenacibaculum phage pT24]BAV39371.1 hypothetical protein BPT24_251 [Tenacibaculum phage pT24]